jgi:predicted nuclease with RNAse H fold
VLTLGIDLASQPKKTAGCLIAWTGDDASVSRLDLGLTDDDIIALAERADVVAIDAPFGWPQPFVDFVSGSQTAQEAAVWDATRRDRLCFRRTDIHVRDFLGRPPLSVSSDKIAITAMRCAGLLERLAVTDRSGADAVVEVYPAVALQVWGFASMGYKIRTPALRQPEGILAVLLGKVMAACPWLRLDDTTRQLGSISDDAFDALIAALVGRAVALGPTIPPPDEDAELAKTEGWIAVPRADTLGQLIGAQPR